MVSGLFFQHGDHAASDVVGEVDRDRVANLLLYCAEAEPWNSQESGKVCRRAYSRQVRGRVSSGWQRSVCFWLGLQVRVSDGSSHARRARHPRFAAAEMVTAGHVIALHLIRQIAPVATCGNKIHHRALLFRGTWSRQIPDSLPGLRAH